MGGMAYGDGSVSGTVSYMGDINGDGNVDISDVILVLRMALQLDPIKPCSDINNDGAVDISDVILTLRMALGLDALKECDKFSGTYSFDWQYDYNIQDGVSLHQSNPVTLEVTRNDSTSLSIKVTATEGTFTLPLVQSNSMATLLTHPYDVGTSFMLEFLLLSDGNNMVLTFIGQEYYNLADISVTVASWPRYPNTVTVDDFVGTWDMTVYSDPNLRNTSDGFAKTNETITISKAGPNQITVNSMNRSFTLDVAGGRATLPTAPVTIGDAVFHALTIISDGKGIAIYWVATETYDLTDVSVAVGLGIKK